jgi:DNA-binding transcriptional MerR regulator
MPTTTTPPKTKPRDHRLTWLDGIPDYLQDYPTEGLYTRYEVIGSLRDRGVDVNEVTLVFWEKTGILPRPVRRWRDGAPRALYPPWAVDAIVHLRNLQAHGRTLDQIAPLMTAHRLASVVWQDPFGPAMTDARSALLAYARALELDILAIEGITIRYNGTDDTPLHEETLTIPVELRQSIVRRQSNS